jgi:hypothetical protein
MEKLDNLVSKIIANILKPDELAFRLIERKLGDKGIHLTDQQELKMKNDIRQKKFDGFQISLSKEQGKALADSNNNLLVLDLGNNIELDELQTNIQVAISKATQETIELISNSLLAEWKSQAPSLLKLQEKDQVAHGKLIDNIWGKPLNLLETLLSVSLVAGSAFNEYYRPAASEENDFVFEALTRLHARGCQVSAEALLLLRNGFADGAHARWRTLHEICVEALFISASGNIVAEKYLSHSIVSDYRSAMAYLEHHKAIGYAAPEQRAIDEIKFAHNKVVSRFGESFKSDYGWASRTLNKKKPTFADLEKNVGLDQLRYFYKLANINVHSGSKGASFRLGLPPNDENILVAGPSIFGHGEPGQNVAYSHYLLTSSLLLTRESLDQIAFLSATTQLMNETVWAFDTVMGKELKG